MSSGRGGIVAYDDPDNAWMCVCTDVGASVAMAVTLTAVCCDQRRAQQYFLAPKH